MSNAVDIVDSARRNLRTGGRGFHITMLNGLTVSAQWGNGNYCQNYRRPHYGPDREIQESDDCEVAIFMPNGDWHVFEGDTVKGYVSADDLARLIGYCQAWQAGTCFAPSI
jgi:hypothetical protein